MIRLPDGTKLDVPAPVRNFERYDHNDRARHAASFRLGYQQRQRVGEFFWTHELFPERAFSTRKQAVEAVLGALNLSSPAGADREEHA